MKLLDVEAAIEAILFVSGEAVAVSKISEAVHQDLKTTKNVIKNLITKYEEENRGIQIIEMNDSYQMCTRKEFFEYIKNLYQNPEKPVLTQSLIETLAIIAYKQPITKAQIEEIRGVSAEHAVNKLIERNLVCEVGRMDVAGKPILFGTTDDFLKYFGFNSTKQLPEIENGKI